MDLILDIDLEVASDIKTSEAAEFEIIIKWLFLKKWTISLVGIGGTFQSLWVMMVCSNKKTQRQVLFFRNLLWVK